MPHITLHPTKISYQFISDYQISYCKIICPITFNITEECKLYCVDLCQEFELYLTKSQYFRYFSAAVKRIERRNLKNQLQYVLVTFLIYESHVKIDANVLFFNF